jgi:uncharacterized Zn finger protein (UPF0148 family)
MKIVKANCPECENPLEFPQELENVLCANCGAAIQVQEYKGVIALKATPSHREPAEAKAVEAPEAIALVDSKLAELDEMLAEVQAEIETLKSREQSAPVQMGCSLFGLFMLVILVIAAFMPLGRKYFGNWMFYLALAVVILLGLRRFRRKQPDLAQIEQLHSERLQAETLLAELQAERGRLCNLKERIQISFQTFSLETEES